MTFLNPLVLLGLAAAAIPVLLHLLNLRKLRTVEFSTLRFLKELQKTKIRRLKLKQILLLILRTLIIVCAVLAFARPTIKSSLPVLGGHAKSSVIIMLDNSFSMDVSDERGNRFRQAKQAAQSIIEALKDGDEVAILQLASPEDQRKTAFTRNFAVARDELQKLPLVPAVARLSAGLRRAGALIGSSANLNREVYLITDAQRNIAEKLRDSVRVFEKGVAVFVVPVGIGSRAAEQNLSVDSLAVLTRIFQPGKLVEAEARIRNSSAKDVQGLVVSMMFNGTRVAQRSVDVPAGSFTNVRLSAAPQARGVYRSSVEIEGDALDMDNRRFFGFVMPKQPALAVFSTPDVQKYLSIVLETAQAQGNAAITNYSPAQLGSVNLADYDMVVLAGGPVRESDAERLAEYARSGGGVFLFAENTTEQNVRNSLRQKFGFSAGPEASFPAAEPAGFSLVDRNHPLFQGVFRGNDSRAQVESPRIFRAMPVRGGQSVIEMPGGSFLAESRVGDGKVLYCAVRPSDDWSSFPSTGLFPTILYRSIFYLSVREALGVDAVAGEEKSLILPKKYSSGGNFRMSDPNGVESFRQAAILPSGAVLAFGAPKQLGVYTVTTGEGQPVLTVAVNPPASESYLAYYSQADLMNAVRGNVDEQAVVEYIPETRKIVQNVARARVGTELWKPFIVAAIICAFVEMFVARNTKNETV